MADAHATSYWVVVVG